MPEIKSLVNHFLIAMPQLNDPHFKQAVVLVYEHNEAGAMGFIVNKPLNFNLGSVLQHLGIQEFVQEVEHHSVLMGGPLNQESGFILYQEKDRKTAENITLSSSKKALTEIAQGQGPQDFAILLGYSSWDAGQLETELANNDWLVAPFSMELVFETPIPQRWYQAALLAGVNMEHMSDQVGHA